MLKLSYEKTTGKNQSSEWKPKTVKEEQKKEAEMGQEDIKEDVTAENKKVQPLKKQKQKKPHLMWWTSSPEFFPWSPFYPYYSTV